MSSPMFPEGGSPESQQPEPPAKKSSSWGVTILIAVVIGAGLIGWKYWNKSSSSDEVKQEVKDLFKDFEDQKLIGTLIDKHHDACFDECYTMGGRRRSAKFDADRYLQMMADRIRTDLLTHGYVFDNEQKPQP